MSYLRSRWRRGLRRFATGSAITLFGLTLVLAFTASVHTEPFRNARSQVIPGSIAVMEKVVIGDIPQMLWFRGVSTEKPALILLHGGPGASESALFRHYNSELEQHFLVVYWEQRGTGRSFYADIPPGTMNIEQFVSDLDEVVALVKQRFNKEKVVLLGHSWGTVLGAIYAYKHPENVAAYVGVGQSANSLTGETRSYEFALSKAKKHGQAEAVRELERIGLPPHTVSEMFISRKWVERFGGTHHADMDTGDLILAALQTDEASWVDLIKFGRGNRFSLEHLWPELRELELAEHHLRFEVPIFFLLGRYDFQVPSVVAENYFEKLKAPCKALVWFEQSAHDPPFEQPKRFNRVLIEDVLPIVRSQTLCGT